MGVPDTDLGEQLTVQKALRNLRVNGLLDEAQFFAEEIRRLEARIFEEECKRAVALRQFIEYCNEED
jgi:hypothetical protein